MAFTASKERKRREPEPFAEGKPLTPSAAIRQWYQHSMEAITRSMLADYRVELRRVLEHPETEAFFIGDANVNDLFQRVLKRLDKKWRETYAGFAKKYSEEFVDKSEDHAKASTWYSLSTAGIKAPIATYTKNVENTIGAAKDFNFTLITNIQKEAHEKIFSAVMVSLTSPDPEQQGASGIQNALVKVGGFTKDRINLISRDQNSKLYASLATERLRQNGVTHFRWLHSSAGKVPRKTHIEKDREVFRVDDPRLWEGPKADQGPPGWAINCRCRSLPLIGYREGEA
jgi:uncharacterized protein with gpF-like domain